MQPAAQLCGQLFSGGEGWWLGEQGGLHVAAAATYLEDHANSDGSCLQNLPKPPQSRAQSCAARHMAAAALWWWPGGTQPSPAPSHATRQPRLSPHCRCHPVAGCTALSTALQQQWEVLYAATITTGTGSPSGKHQRPLCASSDGHCIQNLQLPLWSHAQSYAAGQKAAPALWWWPWSPHGGGDGCVPPSRHHCRCCSVPSCTAPGMTL